MEKELSKKELEKLGVIYLEQRAYPNLFFVPQAGEVNLYPPYTIYQVYERIWEAGVEAGERRGSEERARQIRSALGISE